MPLSTFAMAGISFRTAPIEVRERCAVTHANLADALGEIVPALCEGAVLLSTCNRTEIYVAGGCPEHLANLLASRAGQRADSRAIYVRKGLQAVQHLFRVASGLESQVIGESEILGQLKRAWSGANEAGLTHPLLGVLFQRSMACGKRVRSRTGLGCNVVSVASLAVKLALGRDRSFAGKSVLVVGAGEVGRNIAKTVARKRPCKLAVASHRYEAAEALAGSLGGQPLEMGRLESALEPSDVLFAATRAEGPLLTPRALQGLSRTRRDQGLALFDLGVPRNIDPSVRKLGFVSLYDIEDLNGVCEAHRHSREAWIEAAERIVSEELDSLVDWFGRRSKYVRAPRTVASPLRPAYGPAAPSQFPQSQGP